MTHTTILRSVFVAMLAGALLLGCQSDGTPKTPKARYPTLPNRAVPECFKGSILEYAQVTNVDAFPVSSYGLVVGLHGTGGNEGVPNTVREYIVREMQKHQIGSHTYGDEVFGRVSPERMVDDSRTAIVRVTGLIPPGARKDSQIDVFVDAMPDSQTTSLAYGKLWRTSLRVNGANPLAPGGSVNEYVAARGRIYVNPPSEEKESATEKASLRAGIILGGGVVGNDRPLTLQVFQPQMRLTRAIQERINLRYPKSDYDPVLRAQARDEGMVDLLVPLEFAGNWQHFRDVILHLYMNGSSTFSAIKAKELCEEAVKPDAPLQDITLAWEGLGRPALDFIPALYNHQSADVSYAAVRAGAMLGDPAGLAMLSTMATSKDHPFRLNATKALAMMPPSPAVDSVLSDLLDSSDTVARVTAYQALVRHKAQGRIVSDVVLDSFILDAVPSEGPPLVYASRLGTPRIAVFGRNPTVKMPITYTAMDSRLVITSQPNDDRVLKVIYRDDVAAEARTIKALPELRPLIWQLGGGSPTKENLSLAYGDIVGILQGLSAKGHIPGVFVLQDLPSVREAVDEVPTIPDRGPPAPRAENR